MVRFFKDHYTIDIHTGTEPTEDWLLLIQEITYVLGELTLSGSIPDGGLYYLANLLKELRPNYDVAKKMSE